jgi:hypothetical protein
MRNTSSGPVRWAIWQVTQQAANRGLSVFVPGTTYRQVYGEENYSRVQVASDKRLWHLRYADQVAKFILNPEKGWIVALHGESGIALIETFPIFKALPYPGDTSLELWVNGKGSFTIHGDRIDTTLDPIGCDAFVETEILSPLIELDPGKRYSLEIFWNCASLEGDQVRDVGCHAVIARPLTVTRHDKKLKVTGAYGFFHLGRLEIVGTFRDGKEGPGHTVGPVSPLQACRVEEYIPYELGMCKVRLRLRDQDGKLIGTVDEAAL